MTSAIDHDQLFKQLLETFFVDFIQLFAPALTEHLDLTQLTFLPQQYFTDIIDGDRKAIDILVQLPVKPHKITNSQPTHTILVHIENQSTSETDFAQRIFFYFAELYRQYRIPIYPIAIFSFDRMPPPLSQPATRSRQEFFDFRICGHLSSPEPKRGTSLSNRNC